MNERFLKPNIPLWGSRTYLQSSHLVTALLKNLDFFGIKKVGCLSATFHKFIHFQAKFFLLPETTTDTSELSATFKCKTGEEAVSIGVLPSECHPLSTISDDEAVLLNGLKLLADKKTAVINEYPSVRACSVLVATNKSLLKEIYPLNLNETWTIVRFNIKSPLCLLEMSSPIKCVLDHCIANTMAKTSIYFDNKYVGFTHFIKVKK